MYRLSAFNLSITTSQHLLFIHPASDARSFFISASVHQAPPPLCAVQTVQSLDSLRRKWITLEERRRDCLTDSKSERGRGKSQSGLEWQSGIKKPAVMCDVTPPIQHTHTHTFVHGYIRTIICDAFYSALLTHTVTINTLLLSQWAENKCGFIRRWK